MCAHEPVSYTHLDVYKRQAVGGLVLNTGHGARLEHVGFAEQLLGIAVHIGPVSYTHLVTVTGIYTNLLPENDAVRIKRGVTVYSERELDLLLEDLGGDVYKRQAPFRACRLRPTNTLIRMSAS